MNKTYSVTFSNGITISCSDAWKLRDYLHDMHSAFFELWQYYYSAGNLKRLEKNAKDACDDIFCAIDKINESCVNELK